MTLSMQLHELELKREHANFEVKLELLPWWLLMLDENNDTYMLCLLCDC
jgi:hypothetical protein